MALDQHGESTSKAKSATPKYVVIDFETVDASGPSTEFWKKDFRVISMAASWLAADGTIKSDFMRGECAVEHFLERLQKYSIPVVAHNLQFEMGVTLCRFPETKLQWCADTMRLVQVFDNGGDKFAMEAPITEDQILDGSEEENEQAKPESTAGLGLGKAIRRVLSERDHKRDAYDWLRLNVADCKKGREGQYLDRLPHDRLRAYNVGDTEATLRLYEFIVGRFAEVGYSWKLDHTLYLSSVRHLVAAKIRGVAVRRDLLIKYKDDVEKEIRDIASSFRQQFADQIATVERARLLANVQKRKTLRGRKSYLRRLRSDDDEARSAANADVLFNVGSNSQLQALFCGVMGIQPKFTTAKGAPAFRSAVLSQWGPGGELLKIRRKRLLVLKQIESLLALTNVDGRWHIDLKACGTATGRFAGGSNV